MPKDQHDPNQSVLVDAVVALAAFGGSLLLLARGGLSLSPSRSELDLLGTWLAFGATAPLVVWRRAPFVVFVTAAGVGTLAAGLGYYVGIPLGPAAALYLLARSRDETRPWTLRTVTAVLALFTAFLVATVLASAAFPSADLVHSGLAWAVAWFAGERSRLRREHLADLEERVAHAQRDTEQERLLAVAEERARIARDLHDSAGHAINVIAVRAGAARLRQSDDPERFFRTLEAIEVLARETAEEIDQLVGTLRTGASSGDAVDAPAGLASLDTLVEGHRAAGTMVTVETSGTPRPLGAATDQAAYRILQEAVTNAVRHGSGPVRVTVAYGERMLHVEVVNPVPGAPTAHPGGGHGIIGMRERTALLGGQLHTELADGAFRLGARLPYRGRGA